MPCEKRDTIAHYRDLVSHCYRLEFQAHDHGHDVDKFTLLFVTVLLFRFYLMTDHFQNAEMRFFFRQSKNTRITDIKTEFKKKIIIRSVRYQVSKKTI